MKMLFTSLLLLFVVMAFSSCEKICDIAKDKAIELGTKFEKKWECEEGGISLKFEGILEKTFCKDNGEKLSFERGEEKISICSIVAPILTDLGANYIANKYKCNLELVKSDLSNTTELCGAIGI